jgi:hypothetical protein
MTKVIGETTRLTESNDAAFRRQYDHPVIVIYGDDGNHIPTPPPWELVHWKMYNELLEKKPLLVKSITATIILGGADLFAQSIDNLLGQQQHHAIDWLRAMRFAALGLVGAPWSHYYFHYLDHYLPPTENPCSFVTLLKVFIDQFIQAPILLAIMICALSLMKGEGVSGMRHDMKDSYVTSLIANCKNFFY